AFKNIHAYAITYMIFARFLLSCTYPIFYKNIRINRDASQEDTMNLQNLRVFLKVADLEHITRASEEIGLSQPAVTKTIQSLEHEIGLELVERQGRRIALTHAGRLLQNYARQIFSLERE